MEENKREKYGKYLPIGTLVLLKNGKKRIMIMGFCPKISKNGKDEQYDYCGVAYPEGVISAEQMLLFNHKQISKIYHMGLAKDKEEKKFKRDLRELLKTQNK